MDIAKEFKTDLNKELTGVWIEIGEDAKVLVARSGNKNYDKMMTRIMKPYKSQIRRDSVAPEILERLTIQLMANTILLGWEGIEENGEAIPYSVENAIRLLTDLKDFRETVSSFSNEQSLFKMAEDEEAEKN